MSDCNHSSQVYLEEVIARKNERIAALEEERKIDKAIIAGQYKEVDWKSPVLKAQQERISALEADLSQALDDHTDTGKALLESKKRISALFVLAMQEKIAALEADLSKALDDHADTGKALLESKKRISALEAEVAAKDQRIEELKILVADAPDTIALLKEEVKFYKKRCDELQTIQSRMRDPERQMVCDILANGMPRDKAGIGSYLGEDE